MLMGPQPLQIKQNTRSFKMSALNSLQLFPLRASLSAGGKHVANPVGEGLWQGVSAREVPAPTPCPSSPHPEGVGPGPGPGPSLLPCAAYTMIFVTRGKVVLCCFRVSGGNFCAPTGDSACQLLTGAEAAAAPPSPCHGARPQLLSPQATRIPTAAAWL